VAAATVSGTAQAVARLGEPPKALMLALRDAFGVDSFLETGTYRGGTAAWAAHQFEHVVTIEASEELYRAAVSAHGHLDNLRLVLGDTRLVLAGEIERLDGPAIVWLDSHWSGGATYGEGRECPLLSEIEMLRSAEHEHYLFIDDARLFVAPPPRPHDMDQWPGLVQVTEALTQGERPLEPLILGDTFVAVPAKARPLVRTFAQDVATQLERRSSKRPHPHQLLRLAARLPLRARTAVGRIGRRGRRRASETS
jgi:hypothetical protein